MQSRLGSKKPDWQYLKHDETASWSDKAQALGKKFVATYAFNKNSVTYCCSLTPAYWLVYLGTETEHDELSEEQNEELQNMILEADYLESSGYYDCSYIDSKETHPVPCGIDVDREDFDSDEAFTRAVEDDIRESYHANPW